ncbi:MAG: hypothetical protein ABI281_06470 [Caldimonas sp.]
MKSILISCTVAMALAGMAGTASAKGCLKGAAVGGIGGHVAGHHGLIGAAAGCVIGHHMASKAAKQHHATTAPATTTPATRVPQSAPST